MTRPAVIVSAQKRLFRILCRRYLGQARGDKQDALYE